MPQRIVLMSGNMAETQTELIAAEIIDLGGRVILLDETVLPYVLQSTVRTDPNMLLDGRVIYRGASIDPKSCSGAYIRHVDSEAWELPKELGDSREALIASWIT